MPYADPQRRKSCVAQWKKDHPGRQRFLERRRMLQNKVRVFSAYGNKCQCCGETEPLFLELDHVNNDGAEDRRGKRKTTQQLIDYIIRENFPARFRILCGNCNRGRWRNGGICPHKLAVKV